VAIRARLLARVERRDRQTADDCRHPIGCNDAVASPRDVRTSHRGAYRQLREADIQVIQCSLSSVEKVRRHEQGRSKLDEFAQVEGRSPRPKTFSQRPSQGFVAFWKKKICTTNPAASSPRRQSLHQKDTNSCRADAGKFSEGWSMNPRMSVVARLLIVWRPCPGCVPMNRPRVTANRASRHSRCPLGSRRRCLPAIR